ncbi:MAG TPA: efflux RND transporter periplasmic adaptor subunit [Polyangiaceae bacterium]|nr:efflux RND transporter periplasmic adaptor subunit [Polyangiaceae bacterium]
MIARRVFGVLLSCACASACAHKAAPAPISKRGAKAVAFPVDTMKVDAKPHELVVTAPGVVDAFEHVQVTARVSGVVDKVTFVEGQNVKAGAPLAMIDSRRYALAVTSAQAALEKAQATAADSEANLKRRQNAVQTNPGLIPGEEMETYETQVRTATADVNSMREALKLAQLNMEDSTVKAAMSGVIQTRTVETGQYVNAGTVIATLLQSDPMLLRFNVTTAEAPRLKVGMDAPFTLKESHDTYTAKITLVGGAADPDSRLVPITAQIDTGHKFWLRPGSFATVNIALTSQKQFPMIPEEAARPSDRGFLGYVVDGDIVHERKLELGLHTTDGFVEVKSGVDAGDVIVTKGIEALSDGSHVRLGGVPDTTGAPASSAHAPSGAPAGASSGAHGGGKHRNPEAAPSGAASVASP